MLGLTRSDDRVLRRLTTPSKIQDFLNTLPFNFCNDGDTCYSPHTVIQKRTAHCAEGAIFAALALRRHGYPPLVLDMEATTKDADHMIAVFRGKHGWGAISKTNHAVLRFRDPIYTTIRELVMSYFHEYTDDDGRKSLRTYSRPLDLSRFDQRGWMTSSESVLYLVEHLMYTPHINILSPGQSRTLRKADPIEQRMADVVEWKRSPLSSRPRSRGDGGVK